MRWMTSNGMSRHASNGSGSTVSTTGHLMVVVAIGNGAAVERNCTGSAAGTVSGPPCWTRITAVTSAPNAANRRILVAMKSPRARLPLPGLYKSSCRSRTENENMF
jgi:hypothetical protein